MKSLEEKPAEAARGRDVTHPAPAIRRPPDQAPHPEEAPPPAGSAATAVKPFCPRAAPQSRILSAGMVLGRVLSVVGALYCFLFSIALMSSAFTLLGAGFAAQALRTTSDPLAGLLIGFLATSIVQSSSFTTALAVGLVAAGTLPLQLAIPIVMGANIGTTVTNTIVSLGHVRRQKEFERAFAAGTVHDFFNVLAAATLFPVELLFHPIERLATWLGESFAGLGGLQLASPLQAVIKPATHAVATLIPHPVVLLVLALATLFFSISVMVKLMRRMVIGRAERLFGRVLFRNDLSGFFLGWGLTTVVQSSSVTTSLIVPLVGTGVLSVRRIFTYTLGANVGTTITAILASLALGNPLAIMVAAAHLVFNIMGAAIFYPLRALPIGMATWAGRVASRSRRSTVKVLAVYVLLHAIPILYIILA
ncbi:MAG: Na/Pi cotransporter family protein [Candidatus Eisenbacteria sp.]|nr:Na/Pi cotransporter family protein [Candidatus Eisenbacteria bacterium]